FAARQLMTRPPPNGTPAQSDRTSTPQICTIASAWRGRSIGIGPMGATAGAAVAAGAPDGAAAAAPALAAPLAVTALRQAAESRASLRLRRCNASAPPGCTPEQWDMKSDRHAARMAAFCCAVGAAGAAAGAAGGGALARAGSGGFGSAGFFAGVACRAGSAGGAGAAAAGGGAAGRDCTTAWQLGERSAALAFRHSRISGLLGAIQEQCATKSLSVQA